MHQTRCSRRPDVRLRRGPVAHHSSERHQATQGAELRDPPLGSPLFLSSALHNAGLDRGDLKPSMMLLHQ